MRTLYRASFVHTLSYPPRGEWILVDGRHVQRVGSGEPPEADRIVELPGAPSAREAGYPDMEKIVGWTALMGPGKLPQAIVNRWSDVFARLAKDPDWQAGNARIGGVPAIRSPAATGQYVREQYELYDKLVGALGIRQ